MLDSTDRIDAARAASLVRAYQLGRDDGARGRFRAVGELMTLHRPAYERGYAETRKPARMGRPRKVVV